eukprot:403333873
MNNSNSVVLNGHNAGGMGTFVGSSGLNGLSFINPNMSNGNITINNQTLRNFNTITYELEKINEQIGNQHNTLKQPAILVNDNTAKQSKKQVNNAINQSTSLTTHKKLASKSHKRIPLATLQNNPSLYNTMEMTDFNNTLDHNLNLQAVNNMQPHSTKNKKTPSATAKNQDGHSLQPKQKKKAVGGSKRTHHRKQASQNMQHIQQHLQLNQQYQMPLATNYTTLNSQIFDYSQGNLNNKSANIIVPIKEHKLLQKALNEELGEIKNYSQQQRQPSNPNGTQKNKKTPSSNVIVPHLNLDTTLNRQFQMLPNKIQSQKQLKTITQSSDRNLSKEDLAQIHLRSERAIQEIRNTVAITKNSNDQMNQSQGSSNPHRLQSEYLYTQHQNLQEQRKQAAQNPISTQVQQQLNQIPRSDSNSQYQSYNFQQNQKQNSHKNIVQCESRCSNIQICEIKKNNNQIEQILENYQNLCYELDHDLKRHVHKLPNTNQNDNYKTGQQQQQYQMNQNYEMYQDYEQQLSQIQKMRSHKNFHDDSNPPEVLIANLNESNLYDQSNMNHQSQIQDQTNHTIPIFKDSHYVQKYVNNIASVCNLAKQGGDNFIDDTQIQEGVQPFQDESQKSFSVESSIIQHTGNNEELDDYDRFGFGENTDICKTQDQLFFDEELKRNNEEIFLLTTQQRQDNDLLPYQDSIDSYNTADFTKFSIGELSNKLHKDNQQTHGHQVRMSQFNRVEQLEEGFSMALKIIIKMLKTFRSTELLNYSFLDQIDNLNNLESLVDLLRFINNDPDAYLLKCPKIQNLIRQSFPLIKSQTYNQQHPMISAFNAQRSSMKSSNQANQNQEQFVIQENNQHVKHILSPLSPSVNLVSSAITPIKIQQNLKPAQQKQLIDTFNSIKINQINVNDQERDAQLTLRNHEIFEDEYQQHQNDVKNINNPSINNRNVNLFSQNSNCFNLNNNQQQSHNQQQQMKKSENIFDICEENSHINIVESQTPVQMKRNFKRDNTSPFVNKNQQNYQYQGRVSDISNQNYMQSDLQSEIGGGQYEQDYEASITGCSINQQEFQNHTKINQTKNHDVPLKQDNWQSYDISNLNFSDMGLNNIKQNPQKIINPKHTSHFNLTTNNNVTGQTRSNNSLINQRRVDYSNHNDDNDEDLNQSHCYNEYQQESQRDSNLQSDTIGRQQQINLRDEYQYSDEDEESSQIAADSHRRISARSGRQSHSNSIGKRNCARVHSQQPNQGKINLKPIALNITDEEDQDDDRIMAYLERVETARNKQTLLETQQRLEEQLRQIQQETSKKPNLNLSATEELAVNKSLSSIEYAVNKFLGGFTTLKSEISQLKETVLSQNVQNGKNINGSTFLETSYFNN